MNKVKKLINTILMIAAIALMSFAIAGAVLGCNYALILLVPSFLAMISPIKSTIKMISNKLNINK